MRVEYIKPNLGQLFEVVVYKSMMPHGEVYRISIGKERNTVNCEGEFLEFVDIYYSTTMQDAETWSAQKALDLEKTENKPVEFDSNMDYYMENAINKLVT